MWLIMSFLLSESAESKNFFKGGLGSAIERAVVKKIENKDKINYLTVTVDSSGLDLEKVQIMTFLAGPTKKNQPGFGTVYIPPVGQRVVIAYLNEYKTEAVCLGCIYEEENQTPLKADDKNPQFYFSYGEDWEMKIDKNKKKLELKMGSKQGQEDTLLIDQNKKSFSLSLSDKQTKIEIDGQKGNISLSAKQEIKFAVGQNSISISNSGLKISAKSNLNIEGVNVSVKAQAQAKLEGATAAVKGTASTMLG